MPDNFASRSGDDLVIRIPFERIEEILADVPEMSMLDRPVTVRDIDLFYRQLLANINGSNAIEALLTSEVDLMIENRSRAVELHGRAKFPRAA